MPAPDIDEETENLPSARTFLESVNRGGLLYPSDISYQLCLKCWQIFNQLKQLPHLMNDFVNADAKACFVMIVEQIVDADADLDSICATLPCENGHSLGARIGTRFFNCLVKNYVGEISTNTLLLDRRKRQLAKQNRKFSGGARKLAKLHSEY